MVLIRLCVTDDVEIVTKLILLTRTLQCGPRGPRIEPRWNLSGREVREQSQKQKEHTTGKDYSRSALIHANLYIKIRTRSYTSQDPSSPRPPL